MNIQLRDSRSLQTAIRKARGKNALPPAQLHPELLNGIVEAHRDGFEIRSEILIGELAGEPNSTDLWHLSEFLPAPGPCIARWRVVEIKQGDSAISIPSELIFTFEDNSKLVIRTQAVPDVTKLTAALPTDQTAKFDAVYATGRLAMARADGQKAPASSHLSIADLQTLAPQLGVTWDKNASNETNIERIQDAIKAREAKKTEPAKVAPKPKNEPATA